MDICHVSDIEWDAFVAGHPDGHVLQMSAWGAHQSAFSWQVERVTVRDKKEIVAGAQILFRRLPLGLTRAYIPKGPLADFARPDVCHLLFDAIHRLCRSRRAIELAIEPDWLDFRPEINALTGLFSLASPALRAYLHSVGFKPGVGAVQPPRTILLDITGSEEDTLERMKGKTRYNIRLAGRKGVQVRYGCREDMAAFNHLRVLTGERDDFEIHSARYYERVYDLFVPSDRACLLLAIYEDQPIAAIMPFAVGRKSWYMYGASGNEHRDKMPNYALQWEAIRWARARGCAVYDLWGVPDEDEDMLEAQFAGRHDGLWGVYRFKRGWGGQVVRYVGMFDCVYNQPLYDVYRLALRLKYAE